jgi:hypothetical protein
MGLDMHMYASKGEELTAEDLYEEGKYEQLQSWYWRKANQIHNWMVSNIQDGEDDCGLYEAPISQIKKLYKEVNYALTTGDSSKLPPTPGFFFGSTEVDSWYWEDLRDTQRYLGEMMDDYKANPQTKFYYHSSW